LRFSAVRLTKHSWQHSPEFLTTVEQAGIEGFQPGREHLARRLITLCSGGIDSPDDIRMALEGIAKDRRGTSVGEWPVRLAAFGDGPPAVALWVPPAPPIYRHISSYAIKPIAKSPPA
jgi:hypothetical protein